MADHFYDAERIKKFNETWDEYFKDIPKEKIYGNMKIDFNNKKQVDDVTIQLIQWYIDTKTRKEFVSVDYRYDFNSKFHVSSMDSTLPAL